MKGITVFLIIILVLNIFGLTGCQYVQPGLSKAVAVDPPAAPAENNPKLEGRVTVDISLVGDIMVHSGQLKAAYNPRNGSYSFDEVFKEVEDFLKPADLAVGNLETVLASRDKGYTGYPRFNSPQEILPSLKEAGFDILTNANNHSMDRGESGVLETIQHLNTAEMKHTGTASSIGERSKYLITEIKGIKFGILAYTYGTNGIPLPKGKGFLVNVIDRRQIREDIREIRAQGAEIVLISPHFGIEYRRHPGAAEKAVVEDLFAAGADIVAGGHPHVLQPMVRRDTVKGSGGLFAAYSMGNFISAQKGQYKDGGAILNLKLEKDLASGAVRLLNAEYIPTWVHTYRLKGKIMYRVVAVEKAIRDYEQGLDKKLTYRDYIRLKLVWQETTSLLSGPGSPDIRHV